MFQLAAEFVRKLASSPVTRFAPSPTGYLHLGHVASALYVWGIGRALGARILLRIEDHDATRCRDAYESAIFADLAWLGFNYDNADPEIWRKGSSPYRQSDQHSLYAAAIAKLSSSQKVYACDCSRKRILSALVNAPKEVEGDRDSELRYDGHCRDRQLSWDEKDRGLRLTLPQETISFEDGILGTRVQTPAEQCGDLLLKDRHACYTYQLAVVVDDLRHGVNLIIRGQDLTSSTGRQIIMGRMLGHSDDVQFLHHPLLRDAAGRKLAKRFFSEAVAKRREAGEDASVVRGEAAFLAGLISSPRPLAVEEALALFQIG